jgi:hypothetical protein
MANVYVPNPEELGRRRFPDNKGFRKTLAAGASDVLSLITSLLPSNYPKDPSTNLAIFNNVTSRESARLDLSMNSISDDKQWSSTRIRYLQQILGERLFLSGNLAPSDYNDVSYRDYLISIKNAYLTGSKKSDIEIIASKFTGLDVRIKELYLEAREPNSSLDVTSTHKMVVDVFIDDLLRSGLSMQMLMEELTFFINLVRPAHVLYDTRFIWSDEFDINKTIDLIFGDTGGGCIPVYDYAPFSESVWMAQQVFIVDGPTGSTGQIDSIHDDDLLFYLSNSTKVLTEPGTDGTKIYKDGRRVTFNALEIGQYVFINYITIPGDFQFWWLSPYISFDPSRFYRDIYRRPVFQEFVKKIMDSKGRFPLQVQTTPTTICDRWVQDSLQPLYEDMRSQCLGSEHTEVYDSTVQERMGYPKLSWPYPQTDIYDERLLGNDYIFIVPNSPLTDGFSNPAGISDASVIFDGTSIADSIVSIDASSARITLTQSNTYWDASAGRYPYSGDEFTFNYHYLDGTTNYDASTSYIFGISYWQMPNAPIVQGNGNGDLATTVDMTVSVNGTFITGSVVSLDPLLGHVVLQSTSSFWSASELGRLPIIGDVFEFDYKWGEKYQYSMLFDTPGRVFDNYPGSSELYGLVFDGDLNYSPEVSAISPPSPLEIGYRWRTYLLHHSSVLNSPDTLKLNTYQKPANRASIANQMDVINHYNKVFSPEFLYDTNSIDAKHLDDNYLVNGLDPILKLNEGTPPFQETFWSHDGLILSKKLQDIRTNHQLLLYSDLLLKEFTESGESVPLTSICESTVIRFEIRMGQDDYAGIQECSPWILFDTVETEDVSVSIPGEVRGVPSLRVPGINLRENFILRNIESTGTAIFSYSVHSSIDTRVLSYQIPSFFQYLYNDEFIDFPTLPIKKDAIIDADIGDVEVKVNGVVVPGLVNSINPVTGLITLNPITPYRIDDYITLTQTDIINKRVMLSSYPFDPPNVAFSIIEGLAQYLYDDFYIYGQNLSWNGGILDGLLAAGDIIRISYVIDPLINVDLEFTYRILSTRTITMADMDRTRIFDNGYVFDGGCYDIESVEINWRMNEYLNFMDDYSSGIKLSFFNNSSQQIEDRIFSGPIFEYYDVTEDQIGSPQNFPNALVRVPKFMDPSNPLNNQVDYAFMNDAVVRFRKKTFKELLPDRTFRTTKLTEMMPI